MLRSMLARRAVIMAVSVGVSIIVPFVAGGSPELKWIWDKVGPRIVNRVVDKVAKPRKLKLERSRKFPPKPVRFDDGIACNVGASLRKPLSEYCIHGRGNMRCRTRLCYRHSCLFF